MTGRLYYHHGGTESGTPVGISGQVVYVSGQAMEISGEVVKISGQSVFTYISGGSVVASISGQPVTVSGNAVTVSGNWVDISGEEVITSISGDVVKVSGESVFVYVSGGSFTASVSGQPVDVSGSAVFVYISGGSLTAITDVSGQFVYVGTSGTTVLTTPFYDIAEGAASGSSGDALALTLNSVDTHVVDYATYHGSAAPSTASELYIQMQHGTSTGFYTKVLSVNMVQYAVTNVYWTPDAKLWLASGDSITMVFPNPDNCDYGATIRVRKV